MNTQQFKQHIETIAENINAITGQPVADILPVLKRLNKKQFMKLPLKNRR